MKLNPSEAQRKAMITYLSTPVHDFDPLAKPDYGGWLDALIAAANSVPEGAPVGTIARRPDGAIVAVRSVTQEGKPFWAYNYLTAEDDAVFDEDAADSWPVIYDPTKPEPKEYPYQEGDTTVIGPECFAVTDKGAIAWQGVWYFNPEPTLDYFPPGEEPLVSRPDPTEGEAGDTPETAKLLRQMRERYEAGEGPHPLSGWAKGWDSSSTAQQEPEGGWLRQEFDKAEKRSAQIPDRARCKVVRGTVEDALRPDDVKLLETDPQEFVRRTAQQEPVECPCSPGSGHCVNVEAPKPPRTPRVRDRLGVDEQGARWAAESGGVYHHDGSQWVTTYRHGGVTRWGKGFEPHAYEYTEILEPRVLPSLDCAEARDGTVWTKGNPVSPGRRFQFVSGIWMTRNDDDDWYRLNCDGLLCGSGYTEVIGDPVQ